MVQYKVKSQFSIRLNVNNNKIVYVNYWVCKLYTKMENWVKIMQQKCMEHDYDLSILFKAARCNARQGFFPARLFKS